MAAEPLRYKRPKLAPNRLEKIEYSDCPGSQTAWTARGYLVRSELGSNTANVVPWEDVVWAVAWAAARSPELRSDLLALLNEDKT